MAVHESKTRATISMDKNLRQFISEVVEKRDRRKLSDIIELMFLDKYEQEFEEWLKQKDTNE